MMVLRESAGSGGRMPRCISSARRFSCASSRAISSLAIWASSESAGSALQQGAVLRQVGHGLEVSLALRHQFFQPGVFLPQLLRALRVVERLGIAQGGFDLRKAAGELLDLGTQVHGAKQIRPQRHETLRAEKGVNR